MSPVSRVVMSAIYQIDNFAEKLANEEVEYATKHTVLAELCDIVDSFLGSKEYGYFLDKLVPIFQKLLVEVPISFQSNSSENKVRNLVLEIFQRLVLNEIFKPYAEGVLDSIVRILKAENEDNGVLCIKLVASIHKAYKADLGAKVGEFILIIYDVYGNLAQLVQDQFPDTDGLEVVEETVENDEFTSLTNEVKQELPNTMNSFKTLSECPITMVSLLSSYKQLVSKVLTEFIPKIVQLLQLQVEAQKVARENAPDHILTSVSPEITNRGLYGEFIVSQVKATSFLAYIFIRGYSSDSFTEYHPIIPDLIVRLLQDCPSELSSAKKELLHAMRHILSTPYKNIFIPKIDLLFNEKIFLGDGLTCRETLRPLAYSTIADFAHNIRNELTSEQLWKAILMFCKILQDNSLGVNVSLMCAKLLLNLLERVTELPSAEARKLYFIIIEAFSKKFQSLNIQYETIITEKKEVKKHYNTAHNSILPVNKIFENKNILIGGDDSEEAHHEEVDEEEDRDVEMKDDLQEYEIPVPDFSLNLPIQISKPSQKHSVKDVKYLIRNLMNYLKPVIVHLKYTNPNAPSDDFNKQVWESVARSFTIEELNILSELFKEIILVIRFFQAKKKPSQKSLAFDIKTPTIPIAASKEEKELMESLSVIFMRIDPASFNEILTRHFDHLVAQIIINPGLLHIPHFFLSNEMISGNFMGILINYLNDNLKQLGDLEPMKAHILLRLFKLFLLLLNLYPSQNESVLLPHLNNIILKSLEYSTNTKEPQIYFYFVRILFKSIGGGRFEKLYKEVMPLMQRLLETLNKLIEVAPTSQERDICIELCLSIPVRLSKLVTMLHHLMKPLVLALNGSSELVTQGLRTLELCVDNLNANYFDPIIKPVINDVMKALWQHLKPLPYYYVHSHTAVRILGKLGGRNRNFIKPPEDLQPEIFKTEAKFQVFTSDIMNFDINVATGINAARNILEDTAAGKNSMHYKINAFNYLSAVLNLFIDKSLPQNYQQLIETAIDILPENPQLILNNSIIKDPRKYSNQEQVVETLIKAIIFSASIKPLTSRVSEFVRHLSNHFTQLYIIRALIGKYKTDRPFSVDDGEGQAFLRVDILLTVTTKALGSNVPEIREIGSQAIYDIDHACSVLFGDLDVSLKYGFHSSIVTVLLHSCYDESYSIKLGGVNGLEIMIEKINIPIDWFAKYQQEVIRALFYVLRDTPNYLPVRLTDKAARLIEKVIIGCNKTIDNFQDLSNGTVTSLVYDLASSNKLVRQVAMKSLKDLSEVTNISVLNLISPCKSVLLNPIFAKPLRALPFLMQIGHIEAITYWLELSDKQPEFNDEVQRLFLEVVSLVEAEDSMLTLSDRLIDYETREQLTTLRVVCIKLLSVAIAKPEYSMRIRILAIFFKTLSAPEKKIVDASHEGLKLALTKNNKLPKELLQSGLRPMLMNLSDYRKLTVSNLETLARLLVLLVNYFKVEIGKKLLDHLNSWAMPALLNQVAGSDLTNNRVIQIICSIFNIFHLLPAKAYQFIPDIIKSLKTVESNLRRVDGSLCREPVAKFIDKYPQESSQYFLETFDQRLNLFSYFIRHSSDLKNTVNNDVYKFLDSVKNESNDQVQIIKFVGLAEILMELLPTTEILQDLTNLASEILTKACLIQFNKSNDLELRAAISYLQCLVEGELVFQVLDMLIIHDIALDLILVNKLNEITDLQQCLKFVIDTNVNLQARIYVVKNVVLKLLTYQEIDHQCLEIINLNIWITNDRISSGEIDGFRFELLQMTAILLKKSPEKLDPYKKNIIKFCWNYLKLNDTLVKYAAYLVTCHFISDYETPTKITTQMFFALLRANNFDSRHLVIQLLDLLALVMSQRTGDSNWLNWPRRVISENGFLINNIFNVYKFIVNHGDLFFEVRDNYIASAITAMGKLTILPQSTGDSQTLAIELAELVLFWENKAKNSSLTLGQKEAFVTFLVRYVCITTQRSSSNELGKRALSVIYEILSPDHWPEVSVKLSIFEKFLVHSDLNSGNANLLGYCWNALEVLGVTLEHKSSKWIIENLKPLHQLLSKCIQSSNHDIQEVLQRVLRIILRAINEETNGQEEPEEVKEFTNHLIKVISDDLGSTLSLAAGIMLFSTVANYQPARLNPLIPSVVRTFTKLCKDHVSIMSQKQGGSAENVEEEAKMTSKLLEMILQFSVLRISYFGDHRRAFLSILAQFIERSTDQHLLKNIIMVVYNWIFSNSSFPTNKEKAAILSKMMNFEPRREIPVSLSRDFFKMIIKIFEDDTISQTDLPLRLEHLFLIGTRYSDVAIRKRFMKVLDDSLNVNIFDRLVYVIRDQNWENLADFPWLIQLLELLFGAFDMDYPVALTESEYKFASLSYFEDILSDFEKVPVKNHKLTQFLLDHDKFLQQARTITTGDIILPLVEVLHNDVTSINCTWIELFPKVYAEFNSKNEFNQAFISLLSKEYHIRQVDNKPNCLQALLSGAAHCKDLKLPPHLVKYLGTTFGSYYSAIQILENQAGPDDEQALLEMYIAMDEKNMFYGLWRRKAKYSLTNSGLSFEQIGLYDMAMRYYEHAQIKLRTGVLPYSESEYFLWEDNWILCAEKLQYWDILTELSKHENYTDLLLECGWRVANWNDDKEPLDQLVKTVIDVPTPRRHIFQTFLCIQDFAQHKKPLTDVVKLCDEGIQLALKQWTLLPTRFTSAHIGVLHVFQTYVEFTEASQIYSLLIGTNAQNIEVKTLELKRVLQAWRERLPNEWDDLLIWNDIMVWRQHFFQLVNNIYMPFLQAGKGNVYPQVYSGFHETACAINRFAHVTRKHGLDEVCISQLNKIYNLPNIEITEAFYKLMEQIKCCYRNDKELYTGLDVISNTNLAYFGTKQKAEFFTLKGMFLAKLNSQDKANNAFATAIQLDGNLPKPWAKWGLFNYKLFKQANRNGYKDEEESMQHAKNALICFLHAVGLYKSGKSRRYLALILWVISLDDKKGTLATEFQNYKGEIPVWYWITYIPQLLTSLSHKEASFGRKILILIAKSYPQALHFPLRTTKEDFLALKAMTGSKDTESASESPWEYVEEIMNISKTAYPLLALSLESLVAQITQRFKSNTDEDAYRLIAALYNDGMQSFNRMLSPKGVGQLPSHMISNLVKFADTVLTRNLRAEFERDFIHNKPSYEVYIRKLIKWKERLENKLDRRFNKINLENLCPHLTEFHHQKFEDIEIPGQYLLNKDNNIYFVKIERFLPTLEIVRGYNACYKRLQIRGKEGTIHQFAVQFPSNRHSRREERIFQLFRIFDAEFMKDVQCRSRNINLTLPVAVALSPHIRILSNNNNDMTLQEIYEQICRASSKNIEDPFFYIVEKLKATFDPRLPKPDIVSTMTEIFSAVQTLYVPTTILRDYFMKLYVSYEDFWLFRKQFTSQYASFILITFMMSITSRQPQKININVTSGNVWTSEMLPNKTSHPNKPRILLNIPVEETDEQKVPVFSNPEAVPFRLSPNIQTLIGETGLEGILSVNLLVTARCLSNPEFEIEHFLSLFVRDEVISWFAQNLQSSAQGSHLGEIVRLNVDLISNKISKIGHVSSNTSVTTQAVNELISSAVNPRSLAQLDYLWRPYL